MPYVLQIRYTLDAVSKNTEFYSLCAVAGIAVAHIDSCNFFYFRHTIDFKWHFTCVVLFSLMNILISKKFELNFQAIFTLSQA